MKRGAKGPNAGSFKRGQSGNPGGKPKDLASPEARKVMADIKALAKEYAEEAIKTLAEVMKDAKAPHAAKVAASTAILDRGYGKPSQPIEGQINLFDRMSEDEHRAILAALDALAAREQPLLIEARPVEEGQTAH